MEAISPYGSIRNTWYVAGLSAEFPKEKLTGHVVASRPFVIWRTKDGNVVAYDDRCSHKRFPLSKGKLMPDGTLECAYHGLRYDSSGRCVAIPSHPSGPIPPMAKVRPAPVVEQDGLVWLWPGDPARSTDSKPPRLPEVGDDAWESIVVGPMEVPSNYLLLIENLLDITHFYPLHDGNIGDIANSRIPVELEEGVTDGNRFCGTVRKVESYEQPPYLVDWFHYKIVDRIHTHFMLSPAVTRVQMRNAPPGQLGNAEKERGYVLVHTHTPIDARKHVWRVIISCPAHHMSYGDPTMTAAQRVASMFPKVAAEDRWALEEQQRMVEYPDDGYQEVFLKPDIAIRRARKIFLDLLREEQSPAPTSQAAAE
jgi:phenylpropionate dioxygenase-like ring-hydroxylating dioxygenase large terminal subunit